MSRLVPETQTAKISFYQGRIAKWLENAEAMGSSIEAVAEMQSLLNEAKEARAAQQRAMQLARSLTQRANDLEKKMANHGASIIQQVRAKALMEGTHEALSLASIPPLADPSPIGPPGAVTKFKAELYGANGWLNLSWDCKNPRGAKGTMYEVSRSIGNSSEMKVIGWTGKKKFLDDTVPAGSSYVVYRIRAVRSTKAGVAALFPVQMGDSGNLPAAMRHKPTYQIDPAA